LYTGSLTIKIEMLSNAPVGEIDKTAASFLPNLKQGEVAIVGVSFPIPMTVKISRPKIPPISDGPKFNKLWTGNG